MIKFTEEQILALLAAKNAEEVNKVLFELDVESLIEIMDSLNSMMKLIEMNQYARMKRDDE